MLTVFSFDIVHVLFEMAVTIICQSTVTNHNHKWRVPTIVEIIIIQPLCHAASIYAKNLSYPTYFSV